MDDLEEKVSNFVKNYPCQYVILVDGKVYLETDSAELLHSTCENLVLNDQKFTVYQRKNVSRKAILENIAYSKYTKYDEDGANDKELLEDFTNFCQKYSLDAKEIIYDYRLIQRLDEFYVKDL